MSRLWTADELINTLNMQPLPEEGGYYKVTFNADEQLSSKDLPDRYQSERLLCSAIYYLVTKDHFSAMHKLPTDELYYYHYGDSMEMLLLGPTGEGRKQVLGMDPGNQQFPQMLAPRNWWQGSRPVPAGPFGFSLVSTSMAPAYHQSDPLFGDRVELQNQYPDFKDHIASLTRV